MSGYPEMSGSDSPDIKCFQELPDDTFEAIGLETKTIRRITRQQQNLPIDVIKYLLFTNVPPTVAEEISSSSTRHMFNYDTQSMILKLVTGAHQTASRALLCEVQYILLGMDLHRSILPLGSTRVRGRDAKWPTVAVEIGVSDSYGKLKADAEWWLSNSRGEVKLVIIVSINRKTPGIKFETVVLDVGSLRHSRYVTTIRQTIMVSRRGEQITVSPEVPLTIEFEELFCRQPVSPEHKIDISPDQLRYISSDVWEQQGL
ncbi:uncharacterized protein N7515_008987 [Penicillium bovifimosum]|uniref:Uncharacterized protein n=1 Tax=Penicillium bovifimosum TaxID=126998 RepID=A0A9W9KU37_9EURO|nr:uncharacterized protein N7515_008987 [Penicillium bovifimosum]KAJ5121026.1 hypothetical protein N7515_008987 [Penicillium bovifimosum]